MPKQTIPIQFFKGCLPQILLRPFLNTLSQIIVAISVLLKTKNWRKLKHFWKYCIINIYCWKKNIQKHSRTSCSLTLTKSTTVSPFFMKIQENAKQNHTYLSSFIYMISSILFTCSHFTNSLAGHKTKLLNAENCLKRSILFCENIRRTHKIP